MPVRRDGAAAAFLLALSTREGAFFVGVEIEDWLLENKEVKFRDFRLLALFK